jgi:predicted membrane protein
MLKLLCFIESKNCVLSFLCILTLITIALSISFTLKRRLFARRERFAKGNKTTTILLWSQGRAISADIGREIRLVWWALTCTPLFILYISIMLKLLCFIESKNCVLHVKLYQGCRVPSSSFISIGRFSLFKNIVETHLNRKLSQGSPNQANFSPYISWNRPPLTPK